MNDAIETLRFITNNGELLVRATAEQIEVSALALLVSLLIAVPLGVWLGHIHRGSFIAINIANIGRALPSLAVIAICLAFIGLGHTITIIALVVLAVPPIITNAYVAVDRVEHEVVEAARAMGMGAGEILRSIEIPLAASLLFAGIRTAAVYVIATATLAAIAGGGGLGAIIYSQAAYGFSGVLAAALCAAVLAIVTDALFAGVQRAATPRALRRQRWRPHIGPSRRPLAAEAESTKGSTA